MDCRFDKVLLIGEECGNFGKNVLKWRDDLVCTLDGVPLGDHDLVLLYPSKNFLKPIGKHPNIGTFADIFNPDGVKDFTKEQKIDYCSKIAAMRIHSYLFSFVAGGNVVVFINDNVINHKLWAFGAQKNPYYFGAAPAHKTIDHPLLSIPWDEPSPLNNIFFEGEFPKIIKVRDLLFPDDHPADPFIYAGFSRVLETEIRLSPAYENKFSQVLALLAAPLSGPGGMLLIPPPTQVDEFIQSILTSVEPTDSRAEQDTTAEDHPAYASWHKSKRDFMDFFIPLANADLRSESPKTWRDLAEEASAKAQKQGLIMPTARRSLSRYFDPEFQAWYEQKIAWEKGKAPRPTELF